MKYLIVLGDGMADKNIPELDNRTPLDYADTPAMDKYSKLSEIGMVRTVPEGMAPGSDTANLSVLGYNPRRILYGTFSTRSVKHRCGYETDRCGTAL